MNKTDKTIHFDPDVEQEFAEDIKRAPVWGVDLGRPSSVILEAEAGEDGVFRVEGETDQEIDRIRKEVAEWNKGIQEDINRLILGMFDSDNPRWEKYRE